MENKRVNIIYELDEFSHSERERKSSSERGGIREKSERSTVRIRLVGKSGFAEKDSTHGSGETLETAKEVLTG